MKYTQEELKARLQAAKGRPLKFNEQEIQDVVNKYMEGQTVKNIASQYDVHYTTIQRLLNKQAGL